LLLRLRKLASRLGSYDDCVDDRVLVRVAVPGDCGELAVLCHSLWPDSSSEEHAQELVPLLRGERPGNMPGMVYVAQADDGRLVGFMDVNLRSHADGCDPAVPVGYLEGWYVSPEYRRRGIGGRLLAEAERWSRDQGCKEMASDTWLDHLDSQQAHSALGFEIVDRCVHYRKSL
jgi:aminoglycoside 6'-N-acetyltransferase I